MLCMSTVRGSIRLEVAAQGREICLDLVPPAPHHFPAGRLLAAAAFPAAPAGFVLPPVAVGIGHQRTVLHDLHSPLFCS